MKDFKISYKSNITKILVLPILISLAPYFSSCKKLIGIPAPTTLITSQNVYSTNQTAISVLTGLYANMSDNDMTANGVSGFFIDGGLSADELTLYNTSSTYYAPYYYNHLTADNTSINIVWNPSYTQILTINSAIEGITASNSLTLSIKQQLLGEAYFMRGFFYFYLVNLYGDVPLVLSSDYKVNADLSRIPQIQVYQQIISDLTAADGYLNANYLDATLANAVTQRIRPTKWAAEALLARVYLYYGNLTGDAANYNKAITDASNVISNSLFTLDSLSDVFLANSTETIWSLQPVDNIPGANTGEGDIFILPSTGPNTDQFDPYPVYLNEQLVNSFEVGDQRLVNWVDSVSANGNTYYYSYKYKQGIGSASTEENDMVLRLGEQYLILAEAYANTGDLVNAAKYLNMIRNRAGLPNTTASTQSDMLTAILHERQVELFTEWGHRWLDLKRTKTIDAVMSVVCLLKGTTWNTNWQLYPIPTYDLQADANLVQNPGY